MSPTGSGREGEPHVEGGREPLCVWVPHQAPLAVLRGGWGPYGWKLIRRDHTQQSCGCMDSFPGPQMLCGKWNSSSLWQAFSYRMASTTAPGFPERRTNASLLLHEHPYSLMTTNSPGLHTFYENSLCPLSFLPGQIGQVLPHRTHFQLRSLSSSLFDYVPGCATVF